MRRRAPFTALLSAYAVSVAGTSMSAIAVPWLVLTATGSAASTGVVTFAEMAPYVAAQALAGPLVDRLGLRRCVSLGNVAAAVTVGAIPAMSATGSLSLPVLAALVAVAGAIRGGADCANTALVPATATLGGIALERAAGLNSAANRSALLLGAPLAGALITVTDPALVVAIDAATFAAAAVVTAIWVRVPAAAPTTAAGGSAVRRYVRDLADGLRFLRGDRLLLGIITMVAVSNLLDQGLSAVMLPVWVRDTVGTPAALGVVAAVGGLGSVAGNLIGAWLGPRLSRRALYSVGYLVGGSPRFVGFALLASLTPVLVVTGVTEVFAGSLNTVISATAFERIPADLRARVLGTVRASAWLGIPLGALVAGCTVQAVGVRDALLGFGAVYLVTTLAPFVFPAWRQMRRPASVPVDATDVAVTQASAS
ncbi:MAG TPA: MFS transporter [Micromonosporaceae bacterium]